MVKHGSAGDGLLCIDQWDWKTDAPEFVPGGHAVVALQDGCGVNGMMGVQGITGMPGVAGVGCVGGAGSANETSDAQGGGGVGSVVASGGGKDSAEGARSDASGDASPHVAAVRSQYEWQLRTKGAEIRELQDIMRRLEVETAQVRSAWEQERRTLVRQVGHHRAVLERYCIPLEEASEVSFDDSHIDGYFQIDSSAPEQWGGAGTCVEGPDFNGGIPSSTSTLDSKMRQLNNLLQEEATDRKGASTSMSTGIGNGNTGSGNANNNGVAHMWHGSESNCGDYSTGSITSSLCAILPHATVRATNADVAGGNGVGLLEERSSHGYGEKATGGKAREWEPGEANASNRDAGSGKVGGNKYVGGSAPKAIVAAWGDETAEIQERLRRLETVTGGDVDERAMSSLQTFCAKDAREALQKVDELVEAQGGQCRNLSSILQSLCRKIEKHGGKAARKEAAIAAAASNTSGCGGTGVGAARGRSGGFEDDLKPRRARRGDDEGDAFDSSGSDGGGRGRVQAPKNRLLPLRDTLPSGPQPSIRSATATPSPTGSPNMNTPVGKRGNMSWADIQSGDEDEDELEGTPFIPAKSLTPTASLASPENDGQEHWTTRAVEHAAERGFELRRRDDCWHLQIAMGGLEPMFTQGGMEKYCAWLRACFKAFKDEHGIDAVRRCRGEVDFSHNQMTNDMVWTLLETLVQLEVHVTLLKLFANRISQAGVLAMCEFIRMSTDAVQELHLSHNEIDDDAALELLRTLHQHRDRYPVSRPCERTGNPITAPVWLRLNHNRIREPDRVRRTAAAEGVTICTALDRQACGTSRCCRRECPLVHLFSFSVQAQRGPATIHEQGEVLALPAPSSPGQREHSEEIAGSHEPRDDQEHRASASPSTKNGGGSSGSNGHEATQAEEAAGGGGEGNKSGRRKRNRKSGGAKRDTDGGKGAIQ